MHNQTKSRDTRWRPYLVEYTGSLLTSEVKLPRAWLVLGWGTAWEHLQVLPALSPSLLKSLFFNLVISFEAETASLSKPQSNQNSLSETRSAIV